jgi:hypothetical protein
MLSAISSGPWTALGPGYFLFFAAALLMVHRRYGLYAPVTNRKPYDEHRRTIQACFDVVRPVCNA